MNGLSAGRRVVRESFVEVRSGLFTDELNRVFDLSGGVFVHGVLELRFKVRDTGVDGVMSIGGSASSTMSSTTCEAAEGFSTSSLRGIEARASSTVSTWSSVSGMILTAAIPCDELAPSWTTGISKA